MKDEDFRFIVKVSILLIVVGLLAMGVADHFNWRDLAGAAGIVIGYGGGILQSKSNNQKQSTETGDIINPAPKEASPVKAIVSVLLLALFLPITGQSQVSNLYMAGMSYSAGASPSVAGSALYAHQLSADTAPNLYVFSMIDALPSTYKPFTVTNNIGAGIGTKLVTIANVPIFAPTAAGISYTGTNVGWSWSTGAAAVFKVGDKTKIEGWYLMPTVRVLKSSVSGGTGYQPILGVLVGWGK